MTIHDINIDDKWFRQIILRKKIYEGRIYDKKRQSYDVDDILLINKTYEAKIKNIHTFEFFSEDLYELGVDNILPGINSVDDGVCVYYSIDGYEKKKKNMVFVLLNFMRHSKYDYAILSIKIDFILQSI